MHCPNCTAYVSGDFCTLCDRVIYEKKALVKKPKNVSEGKKKEDIVYQALRLKFLRDRQRCEVFPELKATEVHHKKGRGKYYLDVSTWMAVSRTGHIWIHENDSEARQKGFLLTRTI